MDIEKVLNQLIDLATRKEYQRIKNGQSFVDRIGYDESIKALKDAVIDLVEHLEQKSGRHTDD